jgi:transcriptional regulator with XRE-family HTH domain
VTVSCSGHGCPASAGQLNCQRLPKNYCPVAERARYLIRTSQDVTTAGGQVTEVKAWARRLRGLMESHVSQHEFAGLLGVEARTLRRWCSGESPPGLDSLARIAASTPYTLVEQLADLEYIARDQVPWSVSAPMTSPRLLLDRLWKAVDEATLSRPTHHDLAQVVMQGHADEPTASRYGRWRPRLFDVPTGKRYPHVAYHGVEFQLGLSLEGGVIHAWRQKDWENLGLARPDEFAAPWIKEILADKRRVVDQFRGYPISEGAAWERLELRWRLHDLSRQTPIHWYGEVGRLYRHLIANSMTAHERHIALVRAYQEHLPDPTTSVPAPFLEARDVNLVLLIGSLGSLATYLASVIGEAIGWRSYRAADLVQQYTTRPPVVHTGDAASRTDYAFVYKAISEGNIPGKCVVAISDYDTLVDDAGELTDAARRMLATTGCYVLLLESSPETGALWEMRQQDLLPAGMALRPPHRQDVIQPVQDSLLQALKNLDPDQVQWGHLRANFTVPWWSRDLDEEEIPPFLLPEIGDQIIQASYALLIRLSSGKLPVASRTNTPRMVAGSLLHQQIRDLVHDKEVIRAWQEDPRPRKGK